MSLLAAVNQPSGNPTATGAPQYYFALDSTPADPIVTAEGFDAIGDGTPGGVGSFNARGNGTAPFPAEMFSLSQSAGTPQFSLGLYNVPTGVGSVGNDFAISRYDDNGGYQGPQLVITRSTGDVAVATNLSVASDISCNTALVSSALTVGTAATVGGGALEINGTLGVSQVYDPIYNPPPGAVPGSETLNNSYGPTGTLLTSITYTPTSSGLFSVTMEVSVDTAALAWTNGTDLIVGYMGSPFPPFPVNSDSYLACDSVANPAGFPFPIGAGGPTVGVYKKDMVALVNLTAGVQYAAQAVFSAGINLGTTGGIRFFIQPLLA
jgi:hypothetical protein